MSAASSWGFFLRTHTHNYMEKGIYNSCYCSWAATAADSHTRTQSQANIRRGVVGKIGRRGGSLPTHAATAAATAWKRISLALPPLSASLSLYLSLILCSTTTFRDARSLHMQGFIFAQMVEDYNENWDPFSQRRQRAKRYCCFCCCCCCWASCCFAWKKYSWTPQKNFVDDERVYIIFSLWGSRNGCGESI